MFRPFVVAAFAALVGMAVIGCPGAQPAPEGPKAATATYECPGCKTKVSYTPTAGSTGAAVGQTADHKCGTCKADMKKEIDFCAKCGKDEIFCAKCAAPASNNPKPTEKKGS